MPFAVIMQLLQPMILSLIRHGITTAAGVLVTAGVLQTNQTDQFAGAGLMLFGVLWSIVDKLVRGETFNVLSQIHAPAPTPDPTPKATPGPDAWKAIAQPAALLICAMAMVSIALGSPAKAQVAVPAVQQTWVAVPQPKASTASKPQPKAVSTQDQLFNAILKSSIPDLEYAKALAEASGTHPGKMRAACYAAWSDLAHQLSAAQAGASGMALATPPSKAPMARLEQMHIVADALKPDAALKVTCSSVASMMGLTLAQFIVSTVAGTVQFRHVSRGS